MAEVIVPANSDLVDKTVAEADFRSRYGLTVVGLAPRRHGHRTQSAEEAAQDRRHPALDRAMDVHPQSAVQRKQIWSFSTCRSNSTKCCPLPARHCTQSPAWRWWSG